MRVYGHCNKINSSVGTGRKIAGIVEKANPDANFDIASNPEFLREGAAISDFMRPDRVVVGAETEMARDVMRALYRPLFLIETPILFTNLETSELIKYASNAFLAVKILISIRWPIFVKWSDSMMLLRAWLDNRIGKSFCIRALVMVVPVFQNHNGWSILKCDTSSLVFLMR